MNKKLIIEARVNEYAAREPNPHVPWSAEEIARDALQCREAGASIVHFHSRDSKGAPDFSAKTLGNTVSRIRAASDILIHPTLGVDAAASAAQVRLSPVLGAVDAGLAPDFAPLDMGTSNVDMFAPDTLRFATESSVYVNTTATLRYFAETLRAKNIKPYLVAWNIPMLRWIDAFQRSGILDAPCFVSLALGADTTLPVHPATPAGLRAYLDCKPSTLTCEWSVILAGASLLPLAKSIIEQGGHVSIGLGDYAYPELGHPGNADLVREVVRIAKDSGRDIATPAETREMLGMGNA